MSKDDTLKYGGGSPETMDAALENFPSAAMHTFSFSCTPIELLANDGSGRVFGTASGFYWLHDRRPYVVTNWHVVSGRNPFTGKVLSKYGFIPRRIAIYGRNVEKRGEMAQFTITRFVTELSDEIAEIISAPPQISGCGVDIFAMPIPKGIVFTNDDAATPDRPRPGFSCYLNSAGFKQVETGAGDDCFLLGYPLQNYEGLRLPIWKRGSIATDTSIGVGYRPIFLVDTAATPSMSGSPIIRRVELLVGTREGSGAIGHSTACDFIGIYAGRLQREDMLATNLGYAWYKTLIPKVIANYCFGRWEWSPTDVVAA